MSNITQRDPDIPQVTTVFESWDPEARELLIRLRIGSPSNEATLMEEQHAPKRPERGRVGVSEAARLLGMSRSALDRMLRDAPADLPGSPAQYGSGEKRRHLRWECETQLREWFSAFNSHRVSTQQADSPPPSQKSRRQRRHPRTRAPRTKESLIKRARSLNG